MDKLSKNINCFFIMEGFDKDIEEMKEFFYDVKKASGGRLLLSMGGLYPRFEIHFKDTKNIIKIDNLYGFSIKILKYNPWSGYVHEKFEEALEWLPKEIASLLFLYLGDIWRFNI